MGFKFGGLKFDVGIVTIEVDSIDTDRLTTLTRISLPLGDGRLSFKLYSGIAWRGERAFELAINWTGTSPKEPQQSDEDEQDEDEQDEDDDA